MASIAFEGVSKVFPDGTRAVDGLDLEIADGEFTILVGPSGSGKSTALRMVAGLEDTSGGEITIGSRVVNDVAPKDRDIAMVFQSYALYPHMSVAQNMGFALKMQNQQKPSILGGWGAPRLAWGSASCWSGGRGLLRVASASESRWDARSCAPRRRS
jgi:multiple sugar transport system ATP-binding protein